MSIINEYHEVETSTTQASEQKVEKSQQELEAELIELKNRLHEVNNEAKERRLKLKEFEEQAKSRQEAELIEKEKYKELYESLKKDNEEAMKYKSFYESELEAKNKEVESLEAKLNDRQKQSYELVKDNMDVFKRLSYLKLNIEVSSPTIENKKIVGGAGMDLSKKTSTELFEMMSNPSLKDSAMAELKKR